MYICSFFAEYALKIAAESWMASLARTPTRASCPAMASPTSVPLAMP